MKDLTDIADRLARLTEEEQMSEEVRACIIAQIEGLNEFVAKTHVPSNVLFLTDLKRAAKLLMGEDSDYAANFYENS